MKRVYDDPNDTERRILVFGDKVSDLDLSSLPGHLQDFVRSNGGVPVRHVLRVGYEQLRVDEVCLAHLTPLTLLHTGPKKNSSPRIERGTDSVRAGELTENSLSFSFDIVRRDIWLT
jgi:hypothetical protein